MKRRAVIAVSVGLLVSACSGGQLDEGGADEVASTTTAVSDSSSVESAPALPVADRGADLIELTQIPEYAVQQLFAARSDAIILMTTADGDAIQLARTPSLQPGQAPALGGSINGFGLLSTGTVVYGVGSSDGSSVVVVRDVDGDLSEVGPGSEPTVSDDESLVVYADGTDVVGVDTQTWTEQLRHDAGSDVTALQLAPGGASVAFFAGDDVVVMDLDSGGLRTVERPAAVTYAAPAWHPSGDLAVLQTLQHADGATDASVVIFDVEDRVVETIDLPTKAVAFDFDASGEWILLIDENGALRWVGEGTTGLIDDDSYVRASW